MMLRSRGRFETAPYHAVYLIDLDLEKAMGFAETFADSLKEMPPAPMGEALRPLWQEALAQIEAEHQAGADGQTVARRIAEAMDAVVLSIYQSAMPQTAGPHALVALGGYGRCEMAPHSDVDLLFLFAKSQDKVPPSCRWRIQSALGLGV